MIDEAGRLTIVNRFTSKTKPSLIRGNIVSVGLNIARICRAACVARRLYQ
ncbi:hypothetical protein [Burkholderia sp. Tr-862]|nr:hypothetical protein [Burkholderia sp. Tr-862]